MLYLVDSVSHLGRFFLAEKYNAEELNTVWLEGPDGQIFQPSDVLPVLSRDGRPVLLTGADVVLAWIVHPRRKQAEIELGRKYLAQWADGPQVKLARR